MSDPASPPPFGTLRRMGDRLVYRRPAGSLPESPEASPKASDGAKDRTTGLAPDEAAVRAVRARPLSCPDGEISLLSVDRKEEVAWIPSLDALDAASRALLEEDLAVGTVLPRITRVLMTTPRFGHRYWKVETDRGPMDFLSRSPETNVIWPQEHRCLIRDVLGNCYEIPDLRALDPASREQAMRAL